MCDPKGENLSTFIVRQVIVYVQRGLNTGEDQHTPSDEFYVGKWQASSNPMLC